MRTEPFCFPAATRESVLSAALRQLSALIKRCLNYSLVPGLRQLRVLFHYLCRAQAGLVRAVWRNPVAAVWAGRSLRSVWAKEGVSALTAESLLAYP